MNAYTKLLVVILCHLRSISWQTVIGQGRSVEPFDFSCSEINLSIIEEMEPLKYIKFCLLMWKRENKNNMKNREKTVTKRKK